MEGFVIFRRFGLFLTASRAVVLDRPHQWSGLTSNTEEQRAITTTLNWRLRRLTAKQGLQSKHICVLCFTMAHVKSIDFVADLSNAPFPKTFIGAKSVSDFFSFSYSRLPITRTLANSNQFPLLSGHFLYNFTLDNSNSR